MPGFRNQQPVLTDGGPPSIEIEFSLDRRDRSSLECILSNSVFWSTWVSALPAKRARPSSFRALITLIRLGDTPTLSPIEDLFSFSAGSSGLSGVARSLFDPRPSLLRRLLSDVFHGRQLVAGMVRACSNAAISLAWNPRLLRSCF